MKSIHINVPDDLLEIIDKMVESGLYKNRTEVIHQALINYEPIRHILRRKQIEIIEKIIKELNKQAESMSSPFRIGKIKKVEEKIAAEAIK